MKDSFENIRAEREAPSFRRHQPNQYAGLWKQIALGIIVGGSVLSLIGTLLWLISVGALLGGMNIALPPPLSRHTSRGCDRSSRAKDTLKKTSRIC